MRKVKNNISETRTSTLEISPPTFENTKTGEHTKNFLNKYKYIVNIRNYNQQNNFWEQKII